MRKVLSSKKNNPKCECDMGFIIKDAPKRTISSAWTTRNDSTNIGSVLQPHIYKNPLKQDTAPKGVYKKCLLSENTCYCKDKKIKPKIMSRPKTCLSLDKLRKQIEAQTLTRKPMKKNWITQQCLCKDEDVMDLTRSTDSPVLGDFDEEFLEKCDGLRYTQNRKDYELFRRARDEEDIKELEDYHHTLDVHTKQPEKNKDDKNYSLSTILGTKLDTTRTTSSFKGSSELSPRATGDLNAFRSDHYFETHSTTDLERGRNISHHTCVHKFKLDDRLLPEPLNVDPFGRSRCTICSKPMEGDTVQLSRSYFGDRPSRTTLKNLSKCSELGLVPRSVSIGGNKSKIELRVDGGDKRKFGMFVGKMRKPEYFNSLALRQQKMACY